MAHDEPHLSTVHSGPHKGSQVCVCDRECCLTSDNNRCTCPDCHPPACGMHAETPTPGRENAMPAHKLMTDEEHNRFAFHPATEQTGPNHDRVRAVLGSTAANLCAIVPDGRHRSLMLTALQEAMMWANAAIACDTEAVQA